MEQILYIDRTLTYSGVLERGLKFRATKSSTVAWAWIRAGHEVEVQKDGKRVMVYNPHL